MIWRFLAAFGFRGKQGPELGITDVSRISYRVLPTDIDILGHMNNGRYLSFLDMGRVHLTNRTGLAKQLTDAGIYAVVGASRITYRKSLNLFVKFDIESRFVGADDRSLYIEQRFVVDGEIFAKALVRGRFLRKGAGAVKTVDVSQATGIDFAAYPADPAIIAWANETALPPTRAEAPSVWGEPVSQRKSPDASKNEEHATAPDPTNGI
ncbi:acyl-CoA thioesterase [Humidisolicoccus flavus]|uniref:acyl-CoA thioesterase n=1 Tax=Humidisolicoccus flavus TaxID=3111414 RepID=UPI003247E6FE